MLLWWPEVIESVISIDGSGFYRVHAETPRGQRFMKRVQGCDDGYTAYCDDSRLVRDIADGAFSKGLAVVVNGRTYAGNGVVNA